jgi:hypothetical protein
LARNCAHVGMRGTEGCSTWLLLSVEMEWAEMCSPNCMRSGVRWRSTGRWGMLGYIEFASAEFT